MLSGGDGGKVLFVVALQQAPAFGVVLHHRKHRRAFRINQRLVGKRLLQERQRLPDFDAALLQAFFVQGVALHEMLAQGLGRPLAELHAAPRFDAVADGDDDVEVVVLKFAVYLAFSFLANDPEFPDSCRARQFVFAVDVADMFVDGAHVFVEQLRHLRLRQPDGFLFKGDLQTDVAVVRGVEVDGVFHAGLLRGFQGLPRRWVCGSSSRSR